MRAVDDRLQFRTLGRDDRALAVPLRIVAEIGAYEGDALQLRGRIVGIPHPVETDIGGIFAEIGRCRDTPRDGDAHGLGVHRRIEHLGIAAQQCRNGLQSRFGSRLELDHQLKVFAGILPRPPAVTPEERHQRFDVERLEGHAGRKVFDLVPHEQLAVVQEHVGLDGIDLLGVRLPEGGTAAIIVVRMDQDGALGHSRGAGAQCCEQQPDLSIFSLRDVIFELTMAITGAWSET